MLTLPIKRKWFDMIATGEKPEEYRDITPYYDARFSKAPRFLENGRPQFYIILRAGYRRDSPRMAISCWIDTGEGRPEWGAEPGKKYFRLHITWIRKLKQEETFLWQIDSV